MRVANVRRPCSSKSMTVWCSLTSTSVPDPYVGCITRSPLLQPFIPLPSRLATSAATAAAVAAVAATAAKSTFWFRARFVDRECAAAHLELVQFGSRLLCLLVGGHF